MDKNYQKNYKYYTLFTNDIYNFDKYIDEIKLQKNQNTYNLIIIFFSIIVILFVELRLVK